MATSRKVVVFEAQIDRAKADGARLVMVATMVTPTAPGEVASCSVEFFTQTDPTNPDSFAPMVREDFLAAVQLLGTKLVEEGGVGTIPVA